MTAGSMAREGLEGKREWQDVVREGVLAALASSPECRELASRLASGEEDFKAAEEDLRAAVLSGAGAGLSLLLSEADGRRDSQECGEAMRRRARSSVGLLTLFGLATVERWHWTCGVCGARSCPLDAGLGVETGGERLTPALRSVLGWAAAGASFRGAAEMLLRVAGVSVDAKRVERSAKALGGELSAREAVEDEAAAAAAATAYCCLDGTGVPVLPGERSGAGAKWIWNTVGEQLPGCIEIVDLWHAKEHLWGVGKAVHGAGTEQCDVWSRDVCRALEEGRVDDVLAALRALAESSEEARKCVEYVARNRRRMRYPTFRRMGLCIGSGAVESMCKGLVGERFKRRGMRWSVAGANAILALRAAIFNGSYDDFWQQAPALPLAA